MLKKINNIKNEVVNLYGESYSVSARGNPKCSINGNCGYGL